MQFLIKDLTVNLLPNNHPFAVEINLSRIHAATAHTHPAIREARCVSAQFPAAFCPLENNDLFGGRFYISTHNGRADKDIHAGSFHINNYKIPAIGWAALRAGAGGVVGYFCDGSLLDQKIKEVHPSTEIIEELQQWKEYWSVKEPMRKLRESYPYRLQEALPSDEWLSGFTYPAYPLYRMAGPQLHFDLLLQKGIPGLYRMVEKRQLGLIECSDEWSYCEGWKMSIDIISACARHFSVASRTLARGNVSDDRKNELKQIAAVNDAIIQREPQTLHEAMQLVLLWSMCSTAYCYGRMDEYLGDFLVSDLKRKVLSEDEALNLLKSFWQIVADCGAPYDNRIILGGKGRRNPDNADVFADLAMEATRQVKEPLPQLTYRFTPNTHDPLYKKALTIIGEGRTFPLLYNDSVNIPAVSHAFDVSMEQAEQYTPFGCGEYVLHHYSFGTPSGVLNTAKVLELTLFNGEDQYGTCHSGLKQGSLSDFNSFDELFRAYCANMNYYVDALALQQKCEYRWAAQTCGYNLMSMLCSNCLDRARGMFDGGIEHLGATLESYGQINTADSLFVIKHLVYDTKKISADRLLSALQNNFSSDQELYALIHRIPHYGNDDDEADTMAMNVHNHLCSCCKDAGKKVGLDSYLIVMINNSANTILGSQTAASADGRKAGEPLANGNNPTPGRDKKGVTAFLNSLVKLDTTIHAGAVQNMKFSKAMFTTQRTKLEALLEGYFTSGGAQAMITTVSPHDLQSAIDEPEKWHHLMVRVGGFSARFTHLSPEIQQEVLHRTLHE